MKKIAVAALAMITLLGLTGCDLLGVKTEVKNETKSTLSDWKIKGSFDGWTLHNLTIDELDSNKLTYALSGLYAIDYEFVLVNPAGTEIKYSTDTNVTPGTKFTMGGDKNVSFTAAKSAYTVEVNITTAATPEVDLVGGADAALAVTNQVLADNLKIKGDAFSIGWSDTAGTYDATANTVTWDVTYSSKNGTFGFSSLDNFLQGVTVDLSALTAGGAGTAAVDLLTSGGNAKLTGAPKASSVYTITVGLDVTKAAGSGKYTISIKLKTLGTSDWAFEAPASIFLNGNLNAAGWTDTLAHDEVTLINDVATINYTHGSTASTVGFKYYLANEASWNNMVGISGVDGTGSDVTISGSDNIEFAALADTSYTITLDFSGTFTTTGKPIVNVAVAP